MPRPPVHVRPLTASERPEIDRLVRSGADSRVVRRAQMIRLSSQGMPAGQIAGLWNVHCQTVLRTISKFNAHGLGA